MTVGRRPCGITIRPARPIDWKDKDIVAYISERGCVEYDDIEKQILSDPWIDGWNTRESGGGIMNLPQESSRTRVADRSERYRLKLKGWHDCNEWMKRQKQNRKDVK